MKSILNLNSTFTVAVDDSGLHRSDLMNWHLKEKDIGSEEESIDKKVLEKAIHRLVHHVSRLVVFHYCFPHCPNCLAQLNNIGWET